MSHKAPIPLIERLTASAVCHSVFLQPAPIPWLCPYLHFICLAGVESAISYPFTLFLIHLPHDSVYLSPSCLHLWLSAQLFLSLLHPPQDFSSLTAWLSVSLGVLAKAKSHKLTGFEWCKCVLFSSGDQDFETVSPRHNGIPSLWSEPHSTSWEPCEELWSCRLCVPCCQGDRFPGQGLLKHPRTWWGPETVQIGKNPVPHWFVWVDLLLRAEGSLLQPQDLHRWSLRPIWSSTMTQGTANRLEMRSDAWDG